MSQLNDIQNLILKSLLSLCEKAHFNEAILAKKVRELASIDSKKKAGIALADLEAAVTEAEKQGFFYSLRLNSANDLLIFKSEKTELLNEEAHHRRHQSEKSMEILTLRDLKKAPSGNHKEKHNHDKNIKRSQRTKININSNFEDME